MTRNKSLALAGFLLLLAAAVLFRLRVLTPASPPPTTTTTTNTTTPHSLAEPRRDLPGLPNFAQVSPDLYRGEQPTAEGMQALKKMGIKTVINLRSLHSDRDLLAGTGLHYLHIPSKAWHPEDEDLVRFLKVLADPANRPVFVHCQAGADRTGCAVATYRIIIQGWSPEDAARELPNFGFHPIWTEITQYLNHFDRPALQKKIDAAKPETPELIK